MADTVAAPSPAPSEALRAANVRLLALRREMARERGPRSDPAPKSAQPAVAAAGLSGLPAHMGWGSPAETAALRARLHGQVPDSEPDHRGAARHTPAGRGAPPEAKTAGQASSDEPDARAEAAVKLYPDIGLGMLRRNQAAAGRIWLLCRHLDQLGQGSLRIAILKHHLTSSKSPLRVCGWRQLRNLLRQGDNLFWIRDNDRLWLRSAARVAHGLGVPCLTGRPVAVPVSALCAGMGAARAHLYAAFHSGRVKETPYGRQASPIARETLAALSGVGEVSQRAYEARAGVAVQANFAVGETAAPERRQERAWRQGGALFELKDYRGQQGRQGKTYLAWQLPNSYLGRHPRRPRGRQRRINRKLKDLVTKGTPGNVERPPETPPVARSRRYFPHGKAAAKAKPRRAQERYWRRGKLHHGRVVVWQVVADGC